ncbi:SHOCT domain-containing protein [Janthinobacterium sp. ROICE36]|uniref:SHOCT domain-containing protein n=1 Tax=Janthinobacterium sp. ROICE36 TaxID=2048670 RepID=UPI0011AF270B|nr:SHOCT domain-containing protein [Janthinobacterium sp. ROICE36]
MKITSVKDELEFLADAVLIRKKGAGNFLASGLNGERSIPISTITAIQLKLGGWTPGYILFSYAGSKPFGGGLMEATQDPDAFIFQKQYNSEVEEFKKIVEAAMRDSKNSKTLASPTSLADEIRKLATLVEDGFLSDDEFEVAKRKLLASP